MTDELTVLLGGAVAGTLIEGSNRRLTFTYDDAYRSGADPTPLSVGMPAQIKQHTDRAISPWLWGLLPDNDAVLQRWARHYQASASSPFSMLSTPIGQDCPGAVRFMHPSNTGKLDSRAGGVEWLTENDVAQLLRDLNRDSTAWLGRDFTGQFSLAGAQAKTALLFDQGRWGVPSGRRATSHILKPAIARLDDHDLNEHLCLDAARRLGLVCAQSRIATFGDQTAVVIERYDRLRQGRSLVRIHQEDMCQALGIAPAHKYQTEGGPSPERIASLLRSKVGVNVAEVEVQRFAEALAWSWIIGGTDAHAKNYSLLLSGSQVRLAPLYDIASALPYGHERKLRMAMKVGDEYTLHNYRNPWPRAADRLGLDRDWLVRRVAELASHAPEAFSDASNERSIRSLGRPLPSRLTDLVAARAKRCADLAAA